MEIRINKEIKDYHESLFFGLSFRQFVCSALAVATAVGTYFLSKPVLGNETTSWVSIVCAAPIAVAGFFSYNSMNFEQFVTAYIKSEFIYSGRRVYKSENILYNLHQEVINDVLKKEKQSKRHKKKNTK